MKKVALVFVLAVFVPSLVLAWLAVRSLRDQQFLLERQQSLLYQGVADRLAKDVLDALAEDQRVFTEKVSALLLDHDPLEVAKNFDDLLRKQWPLAQVGFAVTLKGDILSPSPYERAEARLFCADNSRFLANRESVEVYLNPKLMANNQQAQSSVATQSESNTDLAKKYGLGKSQQTRNVIPQQLGGFSQKLSKADEDNQQPFSKVAASEAEFRQLIGDDNEGALARFVDNKLSVLFWCRAAHDPQMILGAQLDLRALERDLGALVQPVEPELRAEICAALLDDTGKPVAVSKPDFHANWKRPFVATEVGETLPHWEVAVYLLDPAKLTRSADTVKLTLGLLIAVLVLAIGIGSWLIVADLNRQLRLARQKTDFVSNVSHELKTPLTSIRMFSELLAEEHVIEPAKQRSYLGIITAETARLTRLINNVLDFARLERGEKKYQFQKCDLVESARETLETYRPHLEANGFRLECDFPSAPQIVRADRDALAQVIVNLLSNAEKYSESRKEIEVRVESKAAALPCVELTVSDRGLGVPEGCGERIFEQFYRAHDSLSSGIQGSGLGLTLARQIARAHGGEVTYAPRDGGGSCFTLRLPLLPDDPGTNSGRTIHENKDPRN
ncbi:MAG TPA: HAMP domain-containing sensor histidine kinase [Candidatus Acidoferrum sp.]|jgi:signal transduction histidine kinase|nr:HAMP domain-containing sensor histidine kinase [Candidatus Acidoferrum sp.]